MNILADSELMQNQKQATVMTPDGAFEVLQSQDGDSLFFSIGTDGNFYLTREVTQTSTGWNQVNLSSSLPAQPSGTTVVRAKMFSVDQEPQSPYNIDLALVVTVTAGGGVDTDTLYLSLGNVNNDDTWANGVTWTAAPFNTKLPFNNENRAVPTTVTISDVFLMNMTPAGATSPVDNIIVDINDPESSFSLDRYYITTQSGQSGPSYEWNYHALPSDFTGITSTCLGLRTTETEPGVYKNDLIPGIYTFGMIESEAQLNYAMQYGLFGAAPDVVNLTVPDGASAIASALNGSGASTFPGASNLFVSGSGGLYVFAPDNQAENAIATQITSILAGASALAAATNGNQTAVWGLANGTLYYVVCAAGSEADPSAWSNPVPLLTGVEGFAFFLNLNAGNNVLFAQTSGQMSGQSLAQLTQDPVTTVWQQRSILLPSTDTDDLITYDSFTTQITITDANNAPAGNSPVSLTATSPVSVYVNDVYQVLSTDASAPFQTTTDATGVLTIVQETDSLGAVCYNVQLPTGESAPVNPMANAFIALGNIKSSDDLSNVTVTNSDGSTQNLLPPTVTSDQVNATAQAIQQFVEVASNLPSNGQTNTSTLPAWTQSAVGFDSAGWTPGELTSAISVAAGDLFSWAKSAYDDVAGFLIQAGETAYDFFVQIGDDLYHVTLDCLRHVAHAVELVFNKIGLFLDDLMKWLGYIFNWSDILRTHSVLKNVLNLYLAQCVANLSNANTSLQAAFTSIEQNVTSWNNPNDPSANSTGSTLDQRTASITPSKGQNSPQSNWAIHHFKSNAASGTTNAQPSQTILNAAESIFVPLLQAVAKEETTVKATIESVKTDIIDNIHTLTAEQIVEKFIQILTDAMLQSMENVLTAAIDVLSQLLDDVPEFLNATVDIPVLSWVYKNVITKNVENPDGDDLTVMDVSCLLAAIATTIVFEAATGAVPFPDNSTTNALINATSIADIQQIYSGSQNLVVGRTTDAHTSATSEAVWAALGGEFSLAGALMLNILSPINAFMANPLTAVEILPAYLLYASSDFISQFFVGKTWSWEDKANAAICDFMVVKAALDASVNAITLVTNTSAVGLVWNMVTAELDFLGNLAWQAPTTGVFCDSKKTTNVILNFTGGTCFDLNGMMSPLLWAASTAANNDPDPVSKIAAQAVYAGLATVAIGLNFAYGAMSCAVGFLIYKGKT